MITLEKNGIKICITHLPGRKKPCLAVQIDSCIYKVASFDDETTAGWFVEILEEMFVKGEEGNERRRINRRIDQDD